MNPYDAASSSFKGPLRQSFVSMEMFIFPNLRRTEILYFSSVLQRTMQLIQPIQANTDINWLVIWDTQLEI